MQHTHPETDELGRENYAYHKRLQLGKKLKFLKPPREFRKYRGHQAPKTQNIICSLGCLIIYVNTKWCPFFQEGQATGSRTEEERRGLDRLQQRKTDNHTRFLSLLYNCECLVPPPPPPFVLARTRYCCRAETICLYTAEETIQPWGDHPNQEYLFDSPAGSEHQQTNLCVRCDDTGESGDCETTPSCCSLVLSWGEARGEP